MKRFRSLGLLAAWLAGAAVAGAAPDSAPRGGRVGWARLVTESSSWTVHSQNDPVLAEFIRHETSLNIDPTFYPADPKDLEQLCGYPLIFTNNLTNLRDPQRLANVREYLRRGGFIYIDRCVNLSFSLEQETFFQRHEEFFARLLPGSELRVLTGTNPIFSCYFSQKDTTSPTQENHNGIYGVYDGGRMVALLSLANYQCGWPNSPLRRGNSLKMIANIYVYAMTRGLEPGKTGP